jgi:hypothetical protein
MLAELDIGTSEKGVNTSQGSRKCRESQEALADIQRQWRLSGSLGSLGSAARLAKGILQAEIEDVLGGNTLVGSREPLWIE